MKKSAESQVISPWLAPWIPVMFMAIIGFFLTRRAMSDGSMNLEGISKFFTKLYEKTSEGYYQFIEFFLKFVRK